MDPMRHPLLHTLVALLIGVVTPLCCCEAMAFAGSVFGGQHGPAPETTSCGHECPGDSASDQQQEVPSDDQQPSPGECPSCPSCQGTSGGTGVKAEANLPVFEKVWNALATTAVAVLWNLPPLAAQSMPGWASDPPFLRANREALRWHCTLLV
ncbi:MAG: hypothetical protein KF699_13520 [Phycisphaeraceae bacterium]|nr:hypothetical protein [Phycisphaeraceae bacterium]MCW5775370.1 hypothetical protein [Phycisphaeraceae bacterium]